MSNLFLMASWMCRWSSDWLHSNVKCVPIGWWYMQMKLWLVAIKFSTCSHWLAVLVHGRCCCTWRWSSDWLKSNFKRGIPIGRHLWCMAGVVVLADKALIGCNQMLKVFLLAGCTCRWSSDWLQSNVKRVPIGLLDMQMKLWLVAIKC